MTEEKKVYESGDDIVSETTRVVNENPVDDADVPMSNGENCGIVEFEGQRINTCKGEKIVDKGYTNPDK